jgi:hypothetical protein
VPLATQRQDDWSAAIYRARNSLPNATYDAINCLVNDEGFLYRRGGSAYWSTGDAGTTLQRIAQSYFPGPAAERVMAWGTHFYALDGAAKSPIDLGSISAVFHRPAFAGGVVAFCTNAGSIQLYGGSLKSTLSLGDGTVTFTNGSTSVTRTGGSTTWVGNIDAGMIARRVTVDTDYGIVKTVTGANALTLVDPWTGPTVSTTDFEVIAIPSVIPPVPFIDTAYLGSAGTPGRLLYGLGNRVYLSASGNPASFDASTYHQLPPGVEIIGAEGIGDSCLRCSRRGVSGGSTTSPRLPVDDDFGNQQQAVSRRSRRTSCSGGTRGSQGGRAT